MNNQTIKTESSLRYNAGISRQTLTRTELINPDHLHTLRYSKLNEEHEGIPTGKLGNQASGFPFTLNGEIWKGTEQLYLCGKWSWEGEDAKAIQDDVRSATCGYAARRYKDAKYRRRTRPDWEEIRVDYMLWCVWQKCLGSEAYRRLLLSLPDDGVVCEVVQRDPFWALREDEEGILRGKNVMGKIITLCRRCLLEGTAPGIDTRLLNEAGIWLLGERVPFSAEAFEA